METGREMPLAVVLEIRSISNNNTRNSNKIGADGRNLSTNKYSKALMDHAGLHHPQAALVAALKISAQFWVEAATVAVWI